jgi:hypothetical protein
MPGKTPSNSNKAKKAVQWATKCSLALFQMPSEQQQLEAWYQPDDYKVFKKNCKLIAQLAQEIGTEAIENQMNDTCRGLELLVSRRRAALRVSRRNIAWDVVLDEQDSQRESGQSSPETIAQLYTKVTSDSQGEAHQQALSHCSKKEEAESSHRKPIAESVKKLTRQQYPSRRFGQSAPETIAQLHTKVTSESQGDAHEQALIHCSKKKECIYFEAKSSYRKPLAESVKKSTRRQYPRRFTRISVAA